MIDFCSPKSICACGVCASTSKDGEYSHSIPPENIGKPGFLMFLGGIEKEHWPEKG